VIEMNKVILPESAPLNNGNPTVAASAKQLKTLVDMPGTTTKNAVNQNGPNFIRNAKTMLYGNQDEVAMLIAKQAFYDKWLHVVQGNRWHQWTGTYWQLDLKAGPFDTTRKAVRKAIREMKKWASSEQKTGKLSEEAKNQLVLDVEKADRTKRDKRYISDIHTLVSKDDKCTATTSQFDTDIHLLGTPIGTVDLKIPEVIKPDPRHFISKQTNCAPVKGDPVYWLQFLDQIFDGDQEVIDFIQVLCGYALTGETVEEKLFFLCGSGANGKSKFLEALTYIWKDYATRIAPTTLLNKGLPEHSTEIAKLAGARLALGSELPVGQVWDDQKLKELTGGDTVTARFMRQDHFDFKPQFTLLLAGNHIPTMKHVGEAERRRFVLVPFKVTIPIERRDPKLGEKFREEAGQILTWCIKGAGMYYKSGLQVPQSILDASQDYLDSEDVVGEFLKSQLTPMNGKEVEIGQLLQSANDWFNDNNHNAAVNSKSLRKELQDRGKSIRRSGSKYYLQNHELLPS
jgi:putative DNA primase/helicase